MIRVPLPQPGARTVSWGTSICWCVFYLAPRSNQRPNSVRDQRPGELPKVLSAFAGVGIVLHEIWLSLHALHDPMLPDITQAVPTFMTEEKKIKDMNVTQHKMTGLNVEKNNYTKQKQKIQAWINLFTSLWLKETLILFLLDCIHSRKNESKAFRGWLITRIID